MGEGMLRQVAAITSVASNQLEKLSVLVIDDHAGMRRIVNTILRTIGVKSIFNANDAAGGFEAISSYQPDVVIVDWEMPGGDGAEFTRLVRTAPESPNPSVPIIFLTSYSDQRRVIEARDAGVTEFLTKPFATNAFYSKLLSIINRPRLFVRIKTYYGPCRRRHANPGYRGPEHRKAPLTGNVPSQARHARQMIGAR